MIEVDAQPFSFRFPAGRLGLIVIDMQRDFVEPGGFGASLGNDVGRLQAIIPTTRRLLDGCRAVGLPIIHTRECHKPDLSDCPPAKRLRGAPTLRIGDEGPMGRVLISDQPGSAIVPELAPLPGEIVLDKPGKGAFYATELGPSSSASASRTWPSPVSPPRSACRRRCARPTTAATSVSSSRMRPTATSRSSRRRRWP